MAVHHLHHLHHHPLHSALKITLHDHVHEFSASHAYIVICIGPATYPYSEPTKEVRYRDATSSSGWRAGSKYYYYSLSLFLSLLTAAAAAAGVVVAMLVATRCLNS